MTMSLSRSSLPRQFSMLLELKGKPEGENLSDAEAFAVEISDLKKIDSRLEVSWLYTEMPILLNCHVAWEIEQELLRFS